MVAKTKKTNAKTTKESIQKKSSSNAALAAKTAKTLKKKKKKKNNTKKKSTTPKEEKPNSSKFGFLHRADGTNAKKNTSSSAFERSVANFPKFDPEAGSSVYGVSSLSHKDHKRWTLDLRSDWPRRVDYSSRDFLSRGVLYKMVAKTTKTNAKTTKGGIQKKSSSNAALAAKTAKTLKKKKKKNNTKKKSTEPKEEKPNSSKFGFLHRADGTNAKKNISSSAFERSVANFPKFDPEAGSSVYGVSSLLHKDHKRWTQRRKRRKRTTRGFQTRCFGERR